MSDIFQNLKKGLQNQFAILGAKLPPGLEGEVSKSLALSKLADSILRIEEFESRFLTPNELSAKYGEGDTIIPQRGFVENPHVGEQLAAVNETEQLPPAQYLTPKKSIEGKRKNNKMCPPDDQLKAEFGDQWKEKKEELIAQYKRDYARRWYQENRGKNAKPKDPTVVKYKKKFKKLRDKEEVKEANKPPTKADIQLKGEEEAKQRELNFKIAKATEHLPFPLTIGDAVQIIERTPGLGDKRYDCIVREFCFAGSFDKHGKLRRENSLIAVYKNALEFERPLNIQSLKKLEKIEDGNR